MTNYASASAKHWHANEKYWKALEHTGQNRAWRLVAMSLDIEPTKGIRARLADEAEVLGEYQHRLRVVRALMTTPATSNPSHASSRGHLYYVPDADDDGVKSKPSASRTERVVTLLAFLSFCEEHDFAVTPRMLGIADALRSSARWADYVAATEEAKMSRNELGGVTRRLRGMSELVLALLARSKDLEISGWDTGKPDAKWLTSPKDLLDRLSEVGVGFGEERKLRNTVEDAVDRIGGRIARTRP